MSHPFTIKSNDIIIASGLHALYLPILRECYDLSIYLDIDEGLRTHFKIKRDVNQRGYSVQRVLNTLAKRLPDSEKFIRPQADFADLIFRLSPINVSTLQNTNAQNLPRLKLTFKSRHGFNELSLKRVLIGVCGLHVDMSSNSPVQYNLAPTAVVSGEVVEEGFIVSSNRSSAGPSQESFTFITQLEREPFTGVAYEYLLTAAATGTNQDVYASLEWQEIT
jgi:hypothetical protein